MYVYICTYICHGVVQSGGRDTLLRYRNAWNRETDICFVIRILEFEFNFCAFIRVTFNRGADKSLARPRRKQAVTVNILMGRGMD